MFGLGLEVNLCRCANIHRGITNNRGQVTTTKDVVDGTYLTSFMSGIRQINRISIFNRGAIFILCRNASYGSCCIFRSCMTTLYHVDIHRGVGHHLGSVATAIDGSDAGESVDIQFRVII